MKQPSSIQINIPTPCLQNWDEMTPCGQGRHCAQCNKTVIDFTTWSDASLHQFFAKDPHNVCGRFRADQLSHPIDLQPQPHGWFYRIVAAMGLSLIFAPKNTQAQAPPDNVEQYIVSEQTKQPKPADTIPKIKIIGTILDEKKQPIIGAIVLLYRDTVLVAGSTSDFDGTFAIGNVEAGSYLLKTMYGGYNAQEQYISVDATQRSYPSITMNPREGNLMGEVLYIKRTHALKKFWPFRWLRRKR